MTAATARVGIVALLLAASTSTAVGAIDPVAAPQNLQVQTAGSNILLTWRAGSENPPDAYRIEAGSGPGLADLAIVNLPWGAQRGVDAQFAAAGVAAGVYYVRVRAVAGRVIGEASEEVVMRVGASSCPMPDAPRNLHASVESPRVTIEWDAPVQGARASGYVLEAGSRPGAPNIAIITVVDVTALSVDAPPGRYFIRLRAMGPCGSSEPTPEVEVIVP